MAHQRRLETLTLEPGSLVASFRSINSQFTCVAKSFQETSETVNLFAKKSEEIHRRNQGSFENLLSKLESQVASISRQREIAFTARNEYYRMSENTHKAKQRLISGMDELDNKSITQDDYDGQLRKFDALTTYTRERFAFYKTSVEKYNQQMHQLFSNLPPFLNTLSFWDREKECMFISIDKFMKSGESGVIGLMASQLGTPNHEMESDALDAFARAESLKNYVSFQERLNLSSKVLMYVENCSVLKIEPLLWEEDLAMKKRESEISEEFIVVPEEETLLTGEEKDILNVILTGFFNGKSEADFSFVLCRLLLDEIFAKESLVGIFLRKIAKRLKENGWRLELTPELLGVFEAVFTKILQSRFISVGREQIGEYRERSQSHQNRACRSLKKRRERDAAGGAGAWFGHLAEGGSVGRCLPTPRHQVQPKKREFRCRQQSTVRPSSQPHFQRWRLGGKRSSFKSTSEK